MFAAYFVFFGIYRNSSNFHQKWHLSSDLVKFSTLKNSPISSNHQKNTENQYIIDALA